MAGYPETLSGEVSYPCAEDRGGAGGGGAALRVGVCLVWEAAERLGALTGALTGG